MKSKLLNKVAFNSLYFVIRLLSTHATDIVQPVGKMYSNKYTIFKAITCICDMLQRNDVKVILSPEMRANANPSATEEELLVTTESVNRSFWLLNKTVRKEKTGE